MPNLFYGLTECPICRKVINQDDEVVAFVAFANPESQFFPFSDAILHKNCFNSHPLAEVVSTKYDELIQQLYFDPKYKGESYQTDKNAIDADTDLR